MKYHFLNICTLVIGIETSSSSTSQLLALPMSSSFKVKSGDARFPDFPPSEKEKEFKNLMVACTEVGDVIQHILDDIHQDRTEESQGENLSSERKELLVYAGQAKELGSFFRNRPERFYHLRNADLDVANLLKMMSKYIIEHFPRLGLEADKTNWGTRYATYSRHCATC